jgi:hypothetical protein
MPITF